MRLHGQGKQTSAVSEHQANVAHISQEGVRVLDQASVNRQEEVNSANIIQILGL